MPKVKPVSLHPLTFDKAMKALISVPISPTESRPKKPRRKEPKR